MLNENGHAPALTPWKVGWFHFTSIILLIAFCRNLVNVINSAITFEYTIILLLYILTREFCFSYDLGLTIFCLSFFFTGNQSTVEEQPLSSECSFWWNVNKILFPEVLYEWIIWPRRNLGQDSSCLFGLHCNFYSKSITLVWSKVIKENFYFIKTIKITCKRKVGITTNKQAQ